MYTDMKRILFILSALFVFLTANGQGRRWAVVELSSIYMRQQPDYESALETQELMGTVVEITAEKGYWREIVSPQPYKAWTTEKGLVEMSEDELRAYSEAPKYMFRERYGHVYSKPSYRSSTICDLVGGDVLRPAEIRSKGKWTSVMLPSGRTGWVRRDALEKLGERIDIRKGDRKTAISSQQNEAVIASALQLLGVPYLWGGMTSKGVDCSGLVRISCIMNGILLPRNASQQIHCGEIIPLDPSAPLAERISGLRRGDLLFFGTPATEDKSQRVTHVGIYLGEGQFIHSSHMVRINSLLPGSREYYENSHRLIAARRIAAQSLDF